MLGSSNWIRCQDRMQQGAADQSNRVINSANEVSKPVKSGVAEGAQTWGGGTFDF